MTITQITNPNFVSINIDTYWIKLGQDTMFGLKLPSEDNTQNELYIYMTINYPISSKQRKILREKLEVDKIVVVKPKQQKSNKDWMFK